MQRLSDTELKVTGIEALNKALGAAGAYRFMTLLHNEQTDYVEISRRLYEGQSIDDIFVRARTEWKG
jgi:glucan biosynthesis protein